MKYILFALILSAAVYAGHRNICDAYTFPPYFVSGQQCPMGEVMTGTTRGGIMCARLVVECN